MQQSPLRYSVVYFTYLIYSPLPILIKSRDLLGEEVWLNIFLPLNYISAVLFLVWVNLYFVNLMKMSGFETDENVKFDKNI